MKRLSLLVLFLAACATASRQAPTRLVPPRAVQQVHVIIAATTDRHGWYDSHHEARNAPPYGGLPLLGGVEAPA